MRPHCAEDPWVNAAGPWVPNLPLWEEGFGARFCSAVQKLLRNSKYAACAALVPAALRSPEPFVFAACFPTFVRLEADVQLCQASMAVPISRSRTRMTCEGGYMTCELSAG